MLRIKLPAGRVTPEQLRAVGELSNEYGRGAGELSTRQTIQLHYLELASLPEVFDRLDDVGLTTVGACGDAVRNVTGCPVAGLAHDELFDVTPVHDEVARRSSTATPTTPTCRASTRSRSPPARTAATRRRSTASRSSARSATASRGFARPRRRRALVGAADRPRPRRLRSARTRRCPCCARCSTPGRKTCATASRA